MGKLSYLFFPLRFTFSVTAGVLRSPREDREGPCVSVRLFSPSSLHPSSLSTEGSVGMCPPLHPPASTTATSVSEALMLILFGEHEEW